MATQAETLARVVELLSRSVLSDRKQDRQNRGWDLQQRHQRLRSLQVGIPKKQMISGFQAGTSSSHQSHPLACHIFFFYCAHHAYLISYHHSDVIQFSFSQIFCMPTWTLFFRPTRLPFKLWDLPGRNQSINKIWQNLCVETICQELTQEQCKKRILLQFRQTSNFHKTSLLSRVGF